MTVSSVQAVFPSNSEQALTEILCAVIRGEVVDWRSASETDFYENLLGLARYHGVGPLVCYRLNSTTAWERLPIRFKDGMLQAVRISAAIEMARSRDLMELCGVLQDRSIEILLLKGCALAYTHYPQPYLRTRGDTDIFVCPKDIRRIEDLFRELGYQSSRPMYKSHQFNCYRNESSGAAVNYDVHWRSSNYVGYARVISHKEAIEGAVTVPALNDCRAMSDGKALLLACVHRAGNPHHDPNRLIWLYDIHLLLAEMSKSEQLWFAEKAVTENLQTICLDAVEKTRLCFATDVADEMLGILMTPSKRYSIGTSLRDSYLGLIIDDLLCLPDITSRFELLRELFMPPVDHLLQKYNKQNLLWIPVLYLRYLLDGLVRR